MNKQFVNWVATDAPDPMLTMQTAGPLLLHYSFHQARKLPAPTGQSQLIYSTLCGFMSTFDGVCL